MYAITSIQRLRLVRPFSITRSNALVSAVVNKPLPQCKKQSLRHLKNKRSHSSLSRIPGTSSIFRLRAPPAARKVQVLPNALGKPRASLKFKLKLPKTLARPKITGNERWIDPEVPIEYARDKLAVVAPSMLQALATTSASISSSSTLPKSVSVKYTDSSIPSGFRPTHMIAVHSAATANSPTTNAVTLYPVHEVVLAAYCGNIPSLPSSSSSSSTEEGNSDADLTLPLVPLNLPSPQTFPLVIHYLYTRNASALLSSLSSVVSSNSQTALGLILGVWKNACALGIDDERFWCALQSAWVGLREAIKA